MMRSGFAIVLLCFLLPGCDQGARLVTSEPSLSEVAGRYSLSSSTFGNDVDSEILSKAKDAYIELSTNGVATLHKLPVVPESSSGGFGVREYLSGSGTFEISALGSTSKSNFYGLYLSVGQLPDPMGNPR